jgi:hypothetical protein
MEYPVIVGYDPDEVSRDEYRTQEAPSAHEAARRALQRQFDRGERYDPGTYTVTVLVDGEPETFEVVAEPVIETYLA